MSRAAKTPTKRAKKKKMAHKARRVECYKYREDLILEVYDLAKAGMTDRAIALALGIDIKTYLRWRDRHRLFKQAIIRGRKFKKHTLREYLYTRLSPDLQELWDKIHAFEKKKDGASMIEAALENKSIRARQQLFLYALFSYNFSHTRARRATRTPLDVFQEWLEDPDFCQLYRAVDEAKKDFFESSLIQLVANGSEKAIIFANKTMNKDRGYSESLNINMNGKVQHTHEVVLVTDLDLPLSVRRSLLDAVKDKELDDEIENKNPKMLSAPVSRDPVTVDAVRT